MANYANLLATIAANIKAGNGVNATTGYDVETALDAMVASLGAGYQFMGVAQPTDTPSGYTDLKCYWLAYESGTYTNFGGKEIPEGEARLAILLYNGSWDISFIHMDGDAVEKNSAPITDWELTDGYIISDKWYLTYGGLTRKSIWIPCAGRRKLWLYSVIGDSSQYAFTKAIPTAWEEAISYATGAGRVTVPNRGEYVDVPADAKYLWIGINQNGVDRTPSQLSLDGYDYLAGAVNNILALAGERGWLASCDLNSVVETGVWVLSSGNTYTNTPGGATTGFLRVTNITAEAKLQEFYSFSGATLYKRRIYNGVAEAWAVAGGGGGGTIINNTFNEYSQTTSVTATPTITTDTNNYLASTGDNTDRTADILALLVTTGACRLGPGKFVVDSLVMPDGSELEGCGPATRVVLAAGSDKFAIGMKKRNAVRNLQLVGSETDISVSAAVGTRHGILWQGNYTQTPDGSLQPQRGILSDLWINNFAGGGITCYDTGYGTYDCIEANNIQIWRCDAGINISYWSEYHKFTNCRTDICYYGCINNGGNNVFVNCDFSSCKEGMLMDNSQGQSPNNSHGSCIGCVFNHTNGNTGVGIRILGCPAGFIFSGCQIFFSQIVLENSDGVVFQGCNFGKNNCDISVNGGGVVLFANNMHQDTPPNISITGNTNVHFVNCYNRATGAPISA